MQKTSLYYENSVYWISPAEIAQLNIDQRVTFRHISFATPLAQHAGKIQITDRALFLENEAEQIAIYLSDIEQVQLGFDEWYPATSTRNFGLFWKPLKITYRSGRAIYLVIGYNYLFTQNERVFQLLKEMLAE